MSKKEKNNDSLKNDFLKGNKISELWNSIPEKLKTPLLFLIILILIVIFYYPVTFGDKTIQSMDVLHNKALREYTTKERDEFTLWNPHIFCGMPAYATAVAQRTFDITSYMYSLSSRVYSIFWKDYNAIYTFSFFIMAITAFLFMRSRGMGRGISFFTSAGMIFSTGIVNLFFSGHATKLVTLSFIPIILMFILKFQKEIKLFDVLLFVITMHLFFNIAHIQIVYYAVLTIIIYFIFFSIHSIVHKDVKTMKQLGKTAAVICTVSVIVFLMSYDTYSQLYEYKSYSTRNSESIKTNTEATTKQNESELYKYNTNWSFSPGEMMTFLIPSFYGYGGSLYKGVVTKEEEQEVNTYFGQMEFVNMPMYMGIVILVLGLFALYMRRKEPFIIFCGITIIFFLLVSFGKNFPVIYDLMFKYAPAFTNFRVPSMILHIVQLIFPVLAGFGIMKFIEMNEANDISFVKGIRYFFFTSVVLLLLAINQENFLANWFISRIDAVATDNSPKSQMLIAFSEYATEMFLSDVYTILILLTVLFLLIWLFLAKKINRIVFISVLIVLVLLDLIRVGERGSVYLDRNEIEDQFRNQEQVKTIRKQKDKEPFRIVDMRQDGLGTIKNNNSYYTYFLLEDISGYCAAKPKNYEDVIQAIGLDNLLFWRMANVKYAITDFPIRDINYEELSNSNNVYTYKCLKALPRAYFVDSVVAKSANEIFNSMKLGTFDPGKVAFVDEVDFKFDKPDPSAYSKIIRYTDERLELNVNATGNNFMVFATTYMPIGWKAKIDGAESKIIKTNHTFMGIVIPKGKHKVEFVYAPDNFFIGKYLSLSLNILVLGGLAGIIYKRRRDKKR